jgi:hypothetical protein
MSFSDCLSDQLRTECAYDDNWDIRELVTPKPPSVVEQ